MCDEVTIINQSVEVLSGRINSQLRHYSNGYQGAFVGRRLGSTYILRVANAGVLTQSDSIVISIQLTEMGTRSQVRVRVRRSYPVLAAYVLNIGVAIALLSVAAVVVIRALLSGEISSSATIFLLMSLPISMIALATLAPTFPRPQCHSAVQAVMQILDPDPRNVCPQSHLD